MNPLHVKKVLLCNILLWSCLIGLISFDITFLGKNREIREFTPELKVLPHKAFFYTPTNPISINNNTDLLVKALLLGWSGDGSPQNPIIIENYNISSTTSNSISIENVTLYFTIRQNWLGYGIRGLFLKNVSNGLIAQNIVLNTKQEGIWGQNLSYVRFINNSIQSATKTGISLRTSENIEIINS